MIDQVIERLKAETSLRKVSGAKSLSRIMKDGRVPAGTHAAFVVPLGLTGGTSDAMAGIFSQNFSQTIGVILMRNDFSSAHGSDSSDELQADIDQTIGVLAGWAPTGALGVFTVGRGQLVAAQDTEVVYQLDFTIQNQLRISR